jgi:hypothetical protein
MVAADVDGVTTLAWDGRRLKATLVPDRAEQAGEAPREMPPRDAPPPRARGAANDRPPPSRGGDRPARKPPRRGP